MQGILAFILVTILACGLAADEGPEVVSCEILQYKTGRLYFSAGEEARIYRHARYAVMNTTGADTVLSGYVEHSWAGISVSFPIDTALVASLTGDLPVLIEPAAIDSTSTITIGTDIPDLKLFSEDSSHDQLIVRHYDRYLAMAQDVEMGVLDGCVSLTKPVAFSDRTILTEYALPYAVSVVPNVGRGYNSQGYLTTSLYYRFDHDRSQLYFVGHIRPQMCLWTTSDTGIEAAHHSMRSRPYPLNPERGRLLIDNLPRSTEKVRLFVGSPKLERLAHYFGDILARDRFTVELTDNKRMADLYLEFVPLSPRVPSTAVYAVQHQMVMDSIPGAPPNESLRICAGLAELVETAQSEQEYYEYLDRMSRRQIMDLGVFPLFRPTLYFSADITLQGVHIDADGFLDFTEAVKVIMPPPPEEAP